MLTSTNIVVEKICGGIAKFTYSEFCETVETSDTTRQGDNITGGRGPIKITK
jgi:hypothetical protein